MKNQTRLPTAELLKMHTPLSDLVLQRRNLRAFEVARRRQVIARGRWMQKLRRGGLSIVERANIKHRVMICDSNLDDYGRNIAALGEDIGGMKTRGGM